MRIAVLFDGGGLARLGLEQAGHECTGFEIDPVKHYLSQFVGSGRSVLADVTRYNFNDFDAVWASPPCQRRSAARTQGEPVSPYADELVNWSLSLPNPVLWVECVPARRRELDGWGTFYNAAQFEEKPRQNRTRIIGGRFPAPSVFRPYARRFPGVSPTITATEWRGCATDQRRASRFYGRRLTLTECAYHQGFDLPVQWFVVPAGWNPGRWKQALYETVGNGVPVYMAKGFGVVVS